MTNPTADKSWYFFILAVLVIAWPVTTCAGAILPADIYRITDGTTETRSQFQQISVAHGEEYILADLKGPAKITYFYITDDTAGHWYPGLVLKVFWDDATNASINVPLADYQSAVMQINHACFACYLPMPFAKRARIVLANDGDHDYSQKVAYGIDWEMNDAYNEEKSRLHCEWRRSHPVVNGMHTILEAKGHGQYVGCFLQVTSRNRAIWFGEGDTIFRVDHKMLTHSPGTEDEFGACWEGPNWQTFSSNYSGHILNQDGTNRMYRWYLPNPVRFRDSLKVEIQNQHQNGIPTTTDADDYISVAFWYQEGAVAASALPPYKIRMTPSFEPHP